MATTYHVGLGQPASQLAVVFASLLTGDSIISYGPYSESNQTIAPPAGISDITWTHVGGDYTLDGTGATGVCFSLAATNTGWNINTNSGSGRVVVTGYTAAQPFVNAGADNSIAGFRLTANGVIGTQQLTAVTTGNSSTFDDLLVDNPVDPTNQNWIGIYIGGTAANVLISNCIVEDVTITGAGKDAYGISMATAAVTPTIYNCTIDNLVADDRVYAIYGYTLTGISILDCTLSNLAPTGRIYGIYGGGGAGNTTYILRNTLSGWNGGERFWGVYLWNPATSYIHNNLLYDCLATGGSTSKGLEVDGALVTAVHMSNNTVVGDSSAATITYGPYAGGTLPPATLCFFAYNNIVTGAAPGGWGYLATNAGNVVSDYNDSHNNPNDYHGNWGAGVNDMIDVDPLFEDPVTHDYRLQATSTLIDAGTAVPTVRYDVAGYSRPQGSAMDLGAYEYLENTKVWVLGSHLAVGSGSPLAANFVLASNPATKVAATNIVPSTDFLSDFGLLTGLAGTIGSTTTFIDATAMFDKADVGKLIYMYNCDYTNWGAATISAVASVTELTVSGKVLDTADPTSGSIAWAVVPAAALPLLTSYSDWARMGSRLVSVEIPTGTPAGDYYIEIINPNGESTIFNDQVITVT